MPLYVLGRVEWEAHWRETKQMRKLCHLAVEEMKTKTERKTRRENGRAR